MSDTLETPRRKRAGDKKKITLYFEEEVGKLYEDGKDNGWDTCEVARKGASDALLARAEILKRKAPPAEQEAG